MLFTQCAASYCYDLLAKRRNTVLPTLTLGSLSKPQRQRQWERRQTKGLMSKTMAVYVRCKFLYISLPFSTTQQREMTKFYVF